MQFIYHLSPMVLPIYNFHVLIFLNITQGQNIDQCNQVLSTLIEKDFPSSCHTFPIPKKGGKSQAKPLVWEFKELGRNGNSGKLECDLHGKSLRGHLLIQRSLSLSSWGSVPWEGLLVRKGANKHSTGRDQGLCLWEKDIQGTFKPRQWR